MPRLDIPRVQIQDAPQARLTPVEAASTAGLQNLGKGITELGRSITHYQSTKETLQAESDLSQLKFNTLTKSQEAFKSGEAESDDYTSKLMKSYDDQAFKLREKITTSAASNSFDQSNIQIRQSLQIQSINQKAELDGARAKLNISNFKNGEANSLFINPADYDSSVLRTNEYVNKPGVPELQRDQLRAGILAELASSAIRGYINLNQPEYAKNLLESGKFDKDISADTKHSLIREAKTGERALKLDKERSIKLEEHIQKLKIEGINTDYLNKLNDGTLTAKEVLANNNLKPFGSGSKDQLLKMIDARNKKLITNGDPLTFRAVYDRINLPENDPNKITDINDIQDFAKTLSISEIRSLKKELSDIQKPEKQREMQLKRVFEQTMRGILTKTNPLTGSMDSEGDRKYLQFMSGFLKDYDKAIESGKTPQQLLTPGSKDYMGERVRAQTIMESAQYQIQALQQSKNTRIEKRKESESVESYINRNKK